MKDRTLHDILHLAKNAKGRTLHDILHEWLMRRMVGTRRYFAAVSLRIHVEFQNDERGKEKDR